jgi:hypothetical protein
VSHHLVMSYPYTISGYSQYNTDVITASTPEINSTKDMRLTGIFLQKNYLRQNKNL